ncbi:MAG: hypothetical protein ABSA93_34565 [Streptosporangiaceae bacterium]|jgi:hypothetical protein
MTPFGVILGCAKEARVHGRTHSSDIAELVVDQTVQLSAHVDG